MAARTVPFARRVRTIRMCSLDARGKGPFQATLLINGGEKISEGKERSVSLPCSRNARPSLGPVRDPELVEGQKDAKEQADRSSCAQSPHDKAVVARYA
jgi:hypothetical protein